MELYDPATTAAELVAIIFRSALSYVYVSYIQADGTVVHLEQPTGIVPSPTMPRKTLVFGDGQQGRQRFKVSAPFGRELLVVLASRSPLFDKPLADNQDNREYLSALRRALIYKPDPRRPDRELAAAVQLVETRE